MVAYLVCFATGLSIGLGIAVIAVEWIEYRWRRDHALRASGFWVEEQGPYASSEDLARRITRDKTPPTAPH